VFAAMTGDTDEARQWRYGGSSHGCRGCAWLSDGMGRGWARVVRLDLTLLGHHAPCAANAAHKDLPGSPLKSQKNVCTHICPCMCMCMCIV
jgi:hypothetical protein